MASVMSIADLDADQIVAQHGPFVMTNTGVIVIGPVTFEEWGAAVTWAQAVERSSPFWIGDLLAYGGEAAYGEKYAQAVEATGHTVGYLMNVASVAQKVPVERRRPELSFSHHQEVAPLDPVEQVAWLDKAEQEDWTSKDLRDQIRVTKAHEQGKTVELGVWAACADLPDQQTLYESLIAAGRAAKKTSKEI